MGWFSCARMKAAPFGVLPFFFAVRPSGPGLGDLDSYATDLNSIDRYAVPGMTQNRPAPLIF